MFAAGTDLLSPANLAREYPNFIDKEHVFSTDSGSVTVNDVQIPLHDAFLGGFSSLFVGHTAAILVNSC